jgi:Transposase DDE domain group 1
LKVQRDRRPVTLTVTADGTDSTVSHVGAALLAETADRLGLTAALSRELSGLRRRRSAHDPGCVVRDLAVMLADGGDALCDLRTLRDQPALFGPVASDATAWRVIDAIVEHNLLDALRTARAVARKRAFALGARPAGPLIIDLDATLVTAHSDKGGAAGTFKGGVGFHPLLAYLDCPGLAGGGQPLAALLRPGNAGANCAADHITVLGDALEQLPREMLVDAEILVRCDSAGATHELLDFCRDGRLGFSVGLDLSRPVREAILALPETAWQPALDADGEVRDNGQVAELTDRLDRSRWPLASRCAASARTPAPSCRSPMPTATASRRSSPTSPTPTSPSWSAATASAPASRTASAPPRTAAWRTSPSATSTPTRSGWNSCCSTRTSSSTPKRCAWTASSPAVNPSACATGCCTAPGA